MSSRPPLPLILVVVAASLIACRHPGEPAPSGRGSVQPSQLTDVTWVLTHLGGSRVHEVPGDAQPYLRFVSGDGRLEGYGSCNGFSAPYSQDGNSVRLAGPAVSTKRACLDPALNDQEQRFLGSLEDLTRYSIDGDVLTLYSNSGVIARLERGMNRD